MRQLELANRPTDSSAIILDSILDDGNPVVVWGFGGMISFICENLFQYGIKILYIVDNDISKQGTYFNGIEIVSFQELKIRCSDANILIGVATDKYVIQIMNQIMRDGQFSKVYCFEMFYPFGEFAQKEIYNNLDNINLINSLLSDNKSRDVLCQKLNYILSKQSDLLVSISDPEPSQYFDDTIINLHDSQGIFIDGGAYHGENTDTMLSKFQNPDIQSICIDADLSNIDYLRKHFSGNPNVSVLYGALSRSNGTLYFQNSGDRGGKASDNGSGVEIPSISIDETFLSCPVSFIKLDIEGSEMNCLLGAIKTIQKYKPSLAICIYHSISDHWNIPLLIHSIRKDYSLFIRHYHKMGIETVLYAV